VDSRQPFTQDPEPSELMEPREGSLDHPACNAQSTAVFRAALGQHRLDPERAGLAAMGFGVVASVSRGVRTIIDRNRHPFKGRLSYTA